MLQTDMLPQLKHRRYYPDEVSVSQTHKDLTEEKYRDLRRPKKVTFFCNGDRFFKGKLLFITPHRYLSFQDLLGDLTGKLPTTSNLPYGVRQIYTPSGGRKVRDIEDLQDGREYVCAGFETFKALKYGSQEVEPWQNGRPHHHGENVPSLDLRGSAFPSGVALGPTSSRQAYASYPLRKPLKAPQEPYSLRYEEKQYGTLTKPKVITLVRAGRKPYSNIKLLLNRRSVQSYEHLLNDISESFGPKWKNNKVRSLYTLSGREVLSLSDFFRGDSIFVAVGTENLSYTDVQDIIETLYPDSPYAKSLLRNIEKQRRKAKQQMLQSLSNTNQEIQGRTGKPDVDTREKPSVTRAVVRPTMVEDTEPNNRIKQKLPEVKATSPIPPDKENQDPEKHLDERTNQRRRDKLQSGDVDNNEEERPKKARPSKAGDLKFKATPLITTSVDEAKPEENNVNIFEQKRLKREAREEKKRQQEKQQQERREKEEKAKAELYRSLQQQVKNEVAGVEEPKPVTDDPSGAKKDVENVKEVPSPVPDKDQKDGRAVVAQTRIRQAKSKEQRTGQLENILDKYDLGRTLGDGNFAVVRMCQHRESGNHYAMKVIDKSKLKGKELMIENEIAIMRACNHDNLVKLYDEYETSEEIYLVMELVKGGDLFDAITQSVKFSEPVASKMTKDMTEALFYLHSRNIVHRDLKPENLMVMRHKDGSVTLKLGDFGLAVEAKSPIFTICGTPTYVAPEILSEIGYGLEVDMWAVGVITYILLCGFPPFRSPERNQTELFEFIKAGHYEFLSPYWDNTSEEAKDLIRHLLIVDKTTRYTTVQVLCHPWVLSVGNSQPLADNLADYQYNLRAELQMRAKQNLEEWRANRNLVFAHHENTFTY